MKRLFVLILCALLLTGPLPAAVAEEQPLEPGFEQPAEAFAEEQEALEASPAEEAPTEAAPEAESAEPAEEAPAGAPEEAPAVPEEVIYAEEAPVEAEELADTPAGAAWPEGMTVENGVVTGYTGSATSLTIPSGVTAIGMQAFAQNQTLQSVTLPSGVKEIQASAFAYCSNLRTISLPGTLEWIGGYAFRATALTEVTIPAGTTEIYNGAFMNCVKLTKVTIPESVFYIADNAMDNHCGGLTIYGKSGSCAETFANANGIKFEPTGSVSLPEVISVSPSASSIQAGKPLTLTVKTSAAAKFLALYSEYNYKQKSWSASGNSTVSGSVRTWTVQYTFADSGTQKMWVRCSADGNYGAGKEFTIQVTEGLPAVSSAAASATSVPARTEVTFTVKTPSSANYLAMFAENGSKVKSWSKSGNSTVSGSVRTWTVQYAISNPGSRRLTFKCSVNGAYGAGKTVSLTVTALPAVTSASANVSSVAAKKAVTFTVKTPKEAKYLALFAENGTKVKVWGMTGNSAVSGSTRTWTVQYAIAGKGSRALTFKCSANGAYGAGKVVKITVK